MVLSVRSLVLASLIALLGLAGQWSDDVSASAWRFAAAVWLVAVVVDGWSARRHRATVTRELPASGYLGQPLPSTLRFESQASHALEIELADEPPEVLCDLVEPRRCRVEPGAEALVATQLVPTALGEHTWSRLRTRVAGPLAMAWWRVDYHLPATVRVVPDHLSAAEHRAGSAGAGRYGAPIAGAGTELLGFRDYRPGDPLRAVDWKATARRRAPVVRVYQAEEGLELVLMIDTGRQSAVRSGRLTRLGHYVNVAARLAERALHSGDHVALVPFAEAPGMVVPYVHGDPGLVRIRHALGALRVSERESNPLAGALRVRTLARHRALVVMLTDFEESAAAGQLLRASALLSGQHLPLVAGLVDETVLALRWSRSTHWRHPYRMLAAQELVQETRRTAVRLQRAGAHVVLARPQELDHRLQHAFQTIRARRGA